MEVELFEEIWGREESIEIECDIVGMKLGLLVVVEVVLLLFAVVGVKSQLVTLFIKRTKASV